MPSILLDPAVGARENLKERRSLPVVDDETVIAAGDYLPGVVAPVEDSVEAHDAALDGRHVATSAVRNGCG
jgi:hypothetical protein